MTPNHTGFHIWRIEDMQVVVVPVESWGKFYAGDSYIIFSSSAYGEPGGMKAKSGVHGGRVEQHIHFWLGEETSNDEAAVAAYKSVELDEHLGGYPIQHREVQGQESKRFIAYFKNGVRYLNGGVKTGLSHYVEDKSPKLFQVKGKRKPIIRQTTHIHWGEMNQGDSFVLDLPEEEVVFVWQGNASNRFEKLQAAKFAQTLKDEHGSPSYQVVVIADGQESADEQVDIFNELLPLAEKGHLKDSAATPDEEDTKVRGKVKLYRCSDSEGKLVLTEVKDGPLQQADLKSEDSFLVDNGNFGIWVWIGKRASEGERREAMRNAQGFIKAKNLKPGTPITRVIDGGEPAEFKSLFQKWMDRDQTKNISRKTSTSGIGKGIARTVQTRFDAQTMHENPKVAATNGMVDDGTGVKEVFRVEMFDLVSVPEEEHGVFFAGDCYVILYAYHDGKKDNYIIYYWIGARSSQDEQGAAALRTIELDDRLGGLPVQVRVVQGKEPQHFLAMFGGKMTIFMGGRASAFDGDDAVDRGIPDQYLLQITGSNKFSTKAIQEDLSAGSLNTNDCFVLVKNREVTVWFGKGSTGDEREMAKDLAMSKSDDPNIIFEGQEKAAFWEALGGKSDYFSQKMTKQSETIEDPRLFQCSNATGNIQVEEILDFEQVDLLEEDVMILDAGHSVFLWFGALSNRTEQQESTRISHEYLESCPVHRDVDTPIVIVKQGREPISFKGYFGSWDEDLWGSIDDLYAQAPPADSQANNNGVFAGYSDGTFPYSVLAGPDCPQSVDPSRKEEYLSDQEFNQVFGMDKEDFSSLPAWKKQNFKKAKNLF